MNIEANEVTLSPITATRLIAVEGKDEINWLSALRNQLGIDNMEIRSLGGIASFSTKIKTLVITPGFTSVLSFGIIRDANSNASATFQSVCSALRNVGLPVPTQPLKPAKAARGKPRVVVLIVPHGESKGMLEDICLQSVGGDPAMTCVETYFKCLTRNLGKLPNNLSKAKVHAFLSSRNEPDLRLGEAAKAGYWPLTHQAFDQVRRFLSLL